MRVDINNDRVLENILIFFRLTALLKKQAHHTKVESKVYTAFINRVNGEIFFLDLLPSASQMNANNWKKIDLCCVYDTQTKQLNLELREPGAQERAFQCEDLTPLAYRVMSETVMMLNRISHSFKETKDVESCADEWQNVTINGGQIDLLKATWHEADRLQAEEILQKRPYGSFLFRQDEYAQILSHELTHALQREIACYTLTFIEPPMKISDLTIVKDGTKWLVYNDDPSLLGRSFDGPEAILGDLKPYCTIPVFH